MRLVLIITLLFGLALCDRPTRVLGDPESQTRSLVGPKRAVPEFTVHVKISPAATEKLRNAGETIKGTIYFDGDGTRIPDETTAPFRTVYLGSYEFELERAGKVIVSDAVISQDGYDRLSDRNYHFTINVTSGRRVFKDNILDGGYATGRLSDLDSKIPIEIQCDLL